MVFKWIPAVMATSHLLIIIIAYWHIGVQAIIHFLGLVSAPLAFLYIGSYLFKFCWYHRMFIHFIATIEIINVTCWYLKPAYIMERLDYIYACITGGFALYTLIRLWTGRKSCEKR